MSFDYTTLITDRTAADAQRVSELAAKGWAAMTAAERGEWWLGPADELLDATGETLYTSDGEQLFVREGIVRGSYNASDTNRVGAAVRDLALRYAVQGYTVTVAPITDRSEGDAPTEEEWAAYLADVEALRDAIAVKPTTPALPETIAGLGTGGANAIEQVLRDLGELLTNAERGWYSSGELYAGEV